MVGTAEYQVGLYSSSQPKNLKASKPGEAITDAPAAIEEAMQPMRPWMGNNGMTTSQQAAVVRCSAALILPAVMQMLRWVSGTIFGRAVVREAWRPRATSSGPPSV